MAQELLVGLAAFLGGIVLSAAMFGLGRFVLDLLGRRSKKLTVADLQRRLSHDKPARPMSVEKATAEEPEHRECSVARCAKKRAINRALAPTRRQAAKARQSAFSRPITTDRSKYPRVEGN